MFDEKCRICGAAEGCHARHLANPKVRKGGSGSRNNINHSNLISQTRSFGRLNTNARILQSVQITIDRTFCPSKVCTSHSMLSVLWAESTVL